MASVIKRGKYWYVKYYSAEIVIGPDGTPRRKQIMRKGYTNKYETTELANQLENDVTKTRHGDVDPDLQAQKVARAKPIAEHIAAYKAHLQAKGCSGNHVAYTIADIERLVTFGALDNAAGITWNLIDTWVADLRKGDAADAPNTINRRVGSVKAFLRHLQHQGGVAKYQLEKYPKLKTKGLEKRHRRALTQAEVTAMLATAPASRKFLYRFALLTGFRYSEIGSLTPTSLDFNAKAITVRAADAKNKARDQSIPMHPDLTEELKKLAHGKAREERLFEMPNRFEAAKLLREDCTTAKVDTTHIDFHALRHTFITRLAEANVHPKILQELARHSTVDTTLRYYTHFRQEDEQKAIAGLTA